MVALLEQTNQVRRALLLLLGVLGVGMSCFHLITASMGSLPTMEQRSVHLSFVLGIIFLRSAASRRDAFGLRDFLDCIMAVCGIVIALFAYWNWEELFARVPFPDDMDLVLGAVLILLVLEGTRRELGNAIPIIAIFFILYALFGNYIPVREIAHRGYSLTRVIANLTMATEGTRVFYRTAFPDGHGGSGSSRQGV